MKKVFEELDLKSKFYEYEESSYQSLMEKISAIDNSGVKKSFEALMAKLYKRVK